MLNAGGKGSPIPMVKSVSIDSKFQSGPFRTSGSPVATIASVKSATKAGAKPR